jgi:predicted nuclease with TOPRIM domain
MADEPDNLILQILRRMEAKLDRVIEDIHDLKVRVTALEEALAGVHRRMDRFETRFDRIERRLELADALL